MDTVFYQPAASPHQAKYRGGVGWAGGIHHVWWGTCVPGSLRQHQEQTSPCLSSDVWIVVVTPRCSMHFLASGCRRTEWNEVSSAETSFLSLVLTHTITGSYAKL